MTEEDWRSREKRPAQGCLNWAVGVGSVFSIFIAYSSTQLDLFTGEHAGNHSPGYARSLLKNIFKNCAVKDAEGSASSLAYPSGGPTHADINTAAIELPGYIITHSINARKLEPRSSCYSVVAISRDNSMASYHITYNKSTGKLLKTCLPAIKGDNSVCKDGTWE